MADPEVADEKPSEVLYTVDELYEYYEQEDQDEPMNEVDEEADQDEDEHASQWSDEEDPIAIQ